MKERPIIFSAPMVQALLEGRKKQTRRIVKGIPDNVTLHTYYGAYTDGRFGSAPRPAIAHSLGWFVPDAGDLWPCNDKDRIRCPYGQPGDRLWVRETWAHHVQAIGAKRDEDGPFVYAADGEFAKQYRLGDKWKPSIFMFRYASRILLEITAVRVERLQDMEGHVAFESDALKEGVNAIHHGDGDYYYSAFRDEPHPENWRDPADAFRELWESINGAGNWAANPWVWVVEFKRIGQ